MRICALPRFDGHRIAIRWLMNRHRSYGKQHFLLLLCFTCSGMSGLIYEVSWVRLLELVFGSTSYAVATVLAVFMGGLALGSYAMGRWAARFREQSPLKLYACMEFFIAILGIAIPFLIHAFIPLEQMLWKQIESSFAATTALRFALSASVLLVPTFLMGATLPLMSEWASDEGRVGRGFVGWLYAANTTGAVIGCALAGLVLFRWIGLTQTQWVAIALNLVAGVGAWQLANSGSAVKTQEEEEELLEREIPGTGLVHIEDGAPTPTDASAIIAMYAISGFVAMLYEVAWGRVLVLVLGSSIYAYSLMLTTFLMGLAGGAWMGARWLRERSHVFHAIVLIQLFIVCTTYVGIQMVEELPYLYLRAYEHGASSPSAMLWMQFLFAFGLMILPTLGLGAMFPVTLQGLPQEQGNDSRWVGRAYAWNTLGAIGGSVAAGFALVPWFGSQKTLLLGVTLNAVVAAWGMSFMRRGLLRRSRRLVSGSILAAGAAAFAFTTPWDPAILSSGIFRNAKDYVGLGREEFRKMLHTRAGDVLFFDEGLTCTVTVTRGRELVHLAVNGKPDASVPTDQKDPYASVQPTDEGDLGTQILLAQMPLLLAEKRDDVLVVGLGSGVTLGSVLTHPVRRVDCLELEHAVVEGSHFFSQYNRNPLQDSRTHLIVNDARNHLLVNSNQYDVIISEPSNPWIPGAANLFTKEFFELSRSRLRPDGVFCLWLQMYETRPEHFQLILRTFAKEFPQVHLFRQGLDAVVVGSVRSLPLRIDRMRARWSPEVQQQMAWIHRTSVEELLASYWIGGKELMDQIAGTGWNTDDNRTIEFAAPFFVLTRPDLALAPKLRVSQLFQQQNSGILPHVQPEEVSRDAMFWYRLSEASHAQQRHVEAVRYGMRSLALAPKAETGRLIALSLLLEGDREKAAEFVHQHDGDFGALPVWIRMQTEMAAITGQWAEVRRSAESWLRTTPDDRRAHYFLGASLFQLNQAEAALEHLEISKTELWGQKEFPKLPLYLGTLYWQRGRYEEASSCYEIYLKDDPANVQARLQWIDALHRLNRETEAIQQCQELTLATSNAGDAVARAAFGSLVQGQLTAAVSQFQAARQLKPWDPEIVLRLAYGLEQQGNLKGATEILENYLRRTPDRPQVVGYLSTLFSKQQNPERAKLLSQRYRVLTGEDWDSK